MIHRYIAFFGHCDLRKKLKKHSIRWHIYIPTSTIKFNQIVGKYSLHGMVWESSPKQKSMFLRPDDVAKKQKYPETQNRSEFVQSVTVRFHKDGLIFEDQFPLMPGEVR